MLGPTNMEELESDEQYSEALNWFNFSPSQHTFSPLWAPTNSSPWQHTYPPLPASLPQPSSSDSLVCHVRASLYTDIHPQNEQHEDMDTVGFYVQHTIHDRGGGVLDVIPAGRLVTINGLEQLRENIEESQVQYLAVLMEEKVRSRNDVLDRLAISQDSNLRFLQRTPEYEDMVDHLVRRTVRVRQYQMEYRGGGLEVIGDALTMNGVEILGLSATPEPSLIFQTTNSRTVWLGPRGQWVFEFHYRWNWLNIGTFKVAEGASLPPELVMRYNGGKNDLVAFPRLFLNENRSEPPPQLAWTSQEENRNEDFGLGCSKAAGNDEVEAVGNIGSDITGDDCVMADQSNSECLRKRKTKEKNPVGERRNKKTNENAAKHLKVGRSTLEHNLISCPNETPVVVDQERIPQLNSNTLPSDQALAATVGTNSVVVKEIPQPQFSLIDQQDNRDDDFGKDEVEAVGMVGEGTGEGKIEEGKFNSGCLGKGKRKEETSGGERRNKKTNGVKIAISLDDILQAQGMLLEDAAKKFNVSRSTLKRVCRKYGILSWPPSKGNEHICQSRPEETPAVVDQAGVQQLNCEILPSDRALAANVDTNSVVLKARWVKDIILMIRLPKPWKMVELEQQVKKRLELESGTYYIRYKDKENELITILCDEDLQEYISSSRPLDTSSIEVFLVP